MYEWSFVDDVEQQICLRGLRSSKTDRSCNTRQARIVLNMPLLPFTITVDAPHHLFYSDIIHLCCDVLVYRSVLDTQPNVQLFKNINSLVVALDGSASNFGQQLLQICKNIRQLNYYWIFHTSAAILVHICVQMPQIDQDERMEKIANLIDLTHITRLEIQPHDDTSHQRLVKKLLL